MAEDTSMPPIINDPSDAHRGHTPNSDHHPDDEEHDSASELGSEQLATEKDYILLQISNFEDHITELKEQINKFELTKKNWMLSHEELRKKLPAADENNLEDDTIIENQALSKTELQEILMLSGLLMERKLFEDKRSVFNQLENKLSEDAQVVISKLDELEKQKPEWESIILQSVKDIVKLKEQATQLQDQEENEATDEELIRIEEEIKNKIDYHMQVISTLEKKNAELCETLDDFDKVKVEFQWQQASIESTKRQLDEKHSQMVRIRSKLHADDYEIFKDECDSLKQQKYDLSQQTGDLEQQVMSLREAQEKLTADIKRLTNEKDENEKQVIDFREQLEKMIESEQELQNLLTQFKNSNQSLESEKMELNDFNISLEITLNELKDANTVLLQEKSEAIEENISLNERINDLSNTLESHEMLKVAHESLKKLNDDISQQTSYMKQQNMMLKEEHDKLRADMKHLTNEKDEHEKQVDALREQMEKMIESEQVLQNLLTQFKNTNQSLESEKMELNDLKISLESKLNELNEANTVLLHEKSVAMDENVSLNERISNLSNTLESLKKCNTDLKEMDAKHLTKIEILIESKIKLLKELNAVQLERAKTDQEFGKANNECSILRLSLENAKHQVQVYEKEFNDLKKSINKTCDHLLELRPEFDALLDMKEQLESEFQRKLMEECELTVADLTNTRSQILVLSDKVDTLTLEKEQLQSSLNQSAERAFNLSDEVNVLQRKLERFDELESRYEQSKLENENLKGSITKFEAKINAENNIAIVFPLAAMESLDPVFINGDEITEVLLSEWNSSDLIEDFKFKEKEIHLKQLYEMQKTHVLNIEQYEQEIQKFQSQIEENRKNESRSRSSRHGYCEPEKQMINKLLGENKELMLKNQSIKAELDESRKYSKNNWKTKRYNNHDQLRPLAWCNQCDVGTMTSPTDKLCNCEKLDKELIESKMNSLKDELEKLKHRIEKEETKKFEMSNGLKKLRLKMWELLKEAKSSTDCDPCISRFPAAFEDRCFLQNNSSDGLIKELAIVRTKYEEAKNHLGFIDTKIKSLEAELEQSSSGTA